MFKFGTYSFVKFLLIAHILDMWVYREMFITVLLQIHSLEAFGLQLAVGIDVRYALES